MFNLKGDKKGQAAITAILVIMLVVLLVILFILILRPSFLSSSGDAVNSYGGYYNTYQPIQNQRNCQTVSVPYYTTESYADYNQDTSNFDSIYVRNTDDRDGEFRVIFYYRDSIGYSVGTKSVRRTVEEGDSRVFYLNEYNITAYDYRVISMDDLDYTSRPYNYAREYVERTRQVLRYREQVQCY